MCFGNYVELRYEQIGALNRPSVMFGSEGCAKPPEILEATPEVIQKALEGPEFYGPGGVVVEGGPAGVRPLIIRNTQKGPAVQLEGLGKDVRTTGSSLLPVLTAGRSDGKLVIEAQNLGDASSTRLACVKAPTAGKGNYQDPACTEVNFGHGEYEAVPTPVRITDRLPEGLKAIAAEGYEGAHKGLGLGGVSCEIESSGRKVKCTARGVVPAYEQIEVLISVSVSPAARSGETNVVSVSGGGAAGTRTVSHGIEVNGSERFGIETYSLVPESFGGTIDTQAGSHPFQVTSVVVANTGYESTAPLTKGEPQTVALARDNVGELPPGMIGNPTPFAQCTDQQFGSGARDGHAGEEGGEVAVNECPAASAVGVALVHYAGPSDTNETTAIAPIFNMVPNHGEPARFAFKVAGLIPVFLSASVRAGGDYGVTISSHDIIQIQWLLSAKLTFWGVPGNRLHDRQRGWECLKEAYPKGGSFSCPTSTAVAPPPFLIMPTSCEAPFESTLLADSWPAEGRPAEVAEPFTYSLPARVDGCNHLPFEPSIAVRPDLPDASASTGLTVDVHVPQSAELNPEGLAEASVKDIAVALPEGVQINPAGGNDLEACTSGQGSAPATPGNQIGYQGRKPFASVPGEELLTFTPQLPGSFGTEGEEATLHPGVNFCPNGSKVGTVDIKTPLLPNELKGAVYLGVQDENPFGSLVAMYIVAEDPTSGTLVKLPGEVSLCHAAGETIAKMTCQAPGQVITTFENSPQLPFEDATLHFFGGERAPLATPARCGAYTTQAAFVPWSAERGDEEAVTVHASSTFQIEHGPDGGPCPGQSLPFSPALHASSSNLNAGSFTPLTDTIGREDGEQNMAQVSLHFPSGLSGLLSGVALCGEAQANEGTCGPGSLIGETTVSAGVGSDPVAVKGGRVYITGPYHGAPFGLSIVNPVKAGPFDLEHDTSRPGEYMPACDCIVVRARVEVDPHTAALTVTTNRESEGYAIPHLIDGVPVQIKKVNVLINRPGFTFNPTNCEPTRITGSITSDEGASSPVSVPFQVTNCAVLKFQPKFQVSTSARTSRANGASLSVKLAYPSASFGTQANIKQVKVELPKQLPSRLTTLQKACTSAQFEANPAGCPPASVVGHAKAITPLIPVPLEGPAYFVSHGGEAFPSLIVVLQGYGVTIDLVGSTFINKAGITSSTFKTVPDAPVGSFELTLPQGKYSALAAHGNLCKDKLTMPTEFLAQNGALIKTTTKIAVTGCTKHKTTKAKHTKKPSGHKRRRRKG
jgi:hypothetical protein